MKISRWMAAMFGIVGFGLAGGAAELRFGPWLSLPENGRVTVNFVADENVGGVIEYREVGTETWLRQVNTLGGQALTDTRRHVVMLEDLKPGAEYEYRVILLNRDGTVETNTGKGGRFRAFSPQDRETRIWVSADLQNSAVHGGELPALLRQLPLRGNDLAMILGDSHYAVIDLEARFVQGVLAPFLAAGAADVPVVLVRGNHEWRGNDSADFVRMYGHPDTRAGYYALNRGPDIFIVLDSGEDKKDRLPKAPYTMRNYSDGYMAAQRRWLEALVQTPAFRNARYRIVFVHNPSYGVGSRFASGRVSRLMEGILGGRDRATRIDLMLGGHEHLYTRGLAGEKALTFYRPTASSCIGNRLSGEKFAYPVIMQDGPGFGGENASASQLVLNDAGIEVRTYAPSGLLIDHMHFAPDGTPTRRGGTDLTTQQYP